MENTRLTIDSFKANNLKIAPLLLKETCFLICKKLRLVVLIKLTSCLVEIRVHLVPSLS